jgi:hypothetical protein
VDAERASKGVVDVPVNIRLLWFLPTAAGLCRRAVVGAEANRQWPMSWYVGLSAYFTLVLAIELNRQPATARDWAGIVVTILVIGLSFRKALRR